MNTALKLVEPETPQQIQEQAQNAAAELSRLQRAAVAAQTAAETVSAAFKADPTPALAAEAMAANQIAENAVAAASKYSDEISALLKAAARERTRAELDEVRAQLRGQPSAPHQEQLAARIRAFRSDVRGDLRALGEAVAAGNQLRQRAKVLAAALGQPENFGAADLAQALSEVLARLEAEAREDDSTAVSTSNATGDPLRETFRVELIGRVGGAS